MSCEHKEIVMFNTSGKKLENGAYEVDFGIRCHYCDKELFRISEYKRTIVNISKH
jgi:hypothetical protein